MEYPANLIEHCGGAEEFARQAGAHPMAPKALRRDAVYMWKVRGRVPFMWRAVVASLQSQMSNPSVVSSPDGFLPDAKRGSAVDLSQADTVKKLTNDRGAA